MEARDYNFGGYHPSGGCGIGWTRAALFENEGRMLYNFIRLVKPELVVEVGACEGCSTSWIAQALEDNGGGRLVSIDCNPYSWGKVPERLLCRVEKVVADVFGLDAEKYLGCDVLFEDGAHLPGFTAGVIKRFAPRWVVVHDYHQPDCAAVRADFDGLLGPPDFVFMEPPSDAGLAFKGLTSRQINQFILEHGKQI